MLCCKRKGTLFAEGPHPPQHTAWHISLTPPTMPRSQKLFSTPSLEMSNPLGLGTEGGSALTRLGIAPGSRNHSWH